MADDGNKESGRLPTTRDAPVLPKIKSEKPLRHDADAWMKVAKNILGPLLAVAEGQTPGSARRIMDVDLSMIPALPAGHRDYERRNEVRLRTRLQNERNQLDRFLLTMRERTLVYISVSTAAEGGAPVLFETMRERCDLSRFGAEYVGFWDGPRAWRLVVLLMNAPRDAVDKSFYRTAVNVLLTNRLSDGCSADEFSLRALGFVTRVNPHHPQPYVGADIGEFIIQMMPPTCATDGRRIKATMEERGTLGDPMAVIAECRKIVHESGAGKTRNKPALVSLTAAALNGCDADMLGMVTGTSITVGTPRVPREVPLAGLASEGDCTTCGKPKHMRYVNGKRIEGTCFQSARFTGPLPLSVDQNPDRKAAIEKARAADAKKLNIEYVPLKEHGPEAIERYKRDLANGTAGRGRGRGRGGGRPPAGAVLPSGEHDESTQPSGACAGFFDNLVEFDDPERFDDAPPQPIAVVIPASEGVPLDCAPGDEPRLDQCGGCVDGDTGELPPWLGFAAATCASFIRRFDATGGVEPGAKSGGCGCGDCHKTAPPEPVMMMTAREDVFEDALEEQDDGLEWYVSDGPGGPTVHAAASFELLPDDVKPLRLTPCSGEDEARRLAEKMTILACAMPSGGGGSASTASKDNGELDDGGYTDMPRLPAVGGAGVTNTGDEPTDLPSAPTFRVAAPRSPATAAEPGSALLRAADSADGGATPLPQAPTRAALASLEPSTRSDESEAFRYTFASPPESMLSSNPAPTPASQRTATVRSTPASQRTVATPAQGTPGNEPYVPYTECYPPAQGRVGAATAAAANRAAAMAANKVLHDGRVRGPLICLGIGLIVALLYGYLATHFQRSVVVGGAAAAVVAHVRNGGYDAARQVYDFTVNHTPVIIALMALCFAVPTTGAVLSAAAARRAPPAVRLDGITIIPFGHEPILTSRVRGIADAAHGDGMGPPSPPPSPPPTRALQPPRVDLLTAGEARALWVELLAGCEQPQDIPEGAKKLIICDTGCARTVLNHTDQTEPGSVREGKSDLCGADGKFSSSHCADSRLPMPTVSHGIGVYRESACILHEPCPYVLLAIGLGSIQQGISMWLPPWGASGHFEFPSGVQVPLLNTAVTVVRPIGYKDHPISGLAAVTLSDLGVPAEGRYILSICSGKRRAGDLGEQLRGDVTVVHIDLLVGGCKHNIVFASVAHALAEAAGDDRCAGAFMALDCSTWSCAHLLPRNDGSPGKPLRSHPDDVLGIRNSDGTLPRKVTEANTCSEHAVAIARACRTHGAPVMSETPACRREGTVDHIRGCENHAYMYDHPAWRSFIDEAGAGVTVADQCMSLDAGMDPCKASVKATAWLGTPDIAPYIQAEFGGRRCTHERGTHRSLGSGADPDGMYPSVGSQQYTATTFKLIANCFRGVLDMSAGGTVAGASIIHGKKMPKSAVTGRFLHRITAHSEPRVVRCLHHAWADAEEWMCERVSDEPCEQCLQGDSSRLGPGGSLPDVDGLVFIDVHHTNVEPHDGSGRNVLGVKHAKSKFLKTVRMKKKSDAPEAIMLCYSYFKSIGCAWSWIHCDNAQDLKGSKVGKLAKEHGWRITCTNVASSNQNPIEPEWRWSGAAVRKSMCMEEGHGVPYEFWCYIWDHEEEGRNLRPSREPPHDCRLGRLLGEKPNGMYRRPALCLCYVTEAPRLPSGTLVHKVRPQATRALHLCYMGGRSGSCDKLGVERCKPGYACLVCRPGGSIEVIVTDDVRFVVDVFPGLKRLSGGGWCIPSENIPFSASNEERLAHSETASKPEKHGETAIEPEKTRLASGTAPGTASGTPSGTESSTAPEGIPDGWVETDLEQGAPGEPTFDVRPGFAPEGGDAPSRGGVTDTPGMPAPGPTERSRRNKPRYMAVRERWPTYDCDEFGGRGWEVTVLQKSAAFWRCRFKSARNKEGKPWVDAWIPKSQISRVDSFGIGHGAEDDSRVTQNAARGEDANVTPNVYTMPHEEGADPMRDPARPQRIRREPERYTVSAMCAAYADAAGASFSATSPRMPIGAFGVNTEAGLQRLQERACATGYSLAAVPGSDWCENRDGKGPMTSEELGLAFSALEPELQRAVCIMADYDEVVAELGADSPQALMVREVYAAQMVEAARAGLKPRALEPLLTVLDPSDAMRELYAGSNDIFDEKYDGCVLMQAHDGMPDDLAMLAKAKTSPDIYTERQMCGPEWDESKCKEINTFYRLGAVEDVLADDPRIKGMPICDSMWAGRCKRDADGAVCDLKGRCVVRGDLQTSFYNITPNQTMSPVVRNTSLMAVDCVACLRSQHMRPYDYNSAYLQGCQLPSEQMVIRPPAGFRRFDERGVEIVWLMKSPLYGQADAGAIWNRTCNAFYCDRKAGLGFERCANDPCVYSKECADGSRRTEVLYVDDGRQYWDPTDAAREAADADHARCKERFKVKFAEADPKEDYFLGANRVCTERGVVTVSPRTYIELMVKRYIDGDCGESSRRFPAEWSYTPASEQLDKAYEAAVAAKPAPSKELSKSYFSLFGSLLHAIKWRPEISAAMGRLGTCLSFPTQELMDCLLRVLVYLYRTRHLGTTYSKHVEGADELVGYADSDWSTTRSTTGFLIMLGGAAIAHTSRRQHCITMSSCEAELVALADLAIEMLYIVDLLTFIGYEVKRPIKCFTDNKGAYDLCHRFTSAQNSRHIDRKLFKMRELRGAGVVSVAHVETKLNPADIFTKITDRQTFERHRATILGLAAARGAGREHREAVAAATSPAMLARVTTLADAIAAHYEPGPSAAG